MNLVHARDVALARHIGVDFQDCRPGLRADGSIGGHSGPISLNWRACATPRRQSDPHARRSRKSARRRPPADRRASLTASGDIAPGRATRSASPIPLAAEPIASAPILRRTVRDVGAPAVERDGLEHDVARRSVDQWLRDHEHRHAGRMIGALDERQPGDDLRRVRRRKLGPPGAGPRAPVDREHAEIADRLADRADHLARAEMRHAGRREPEVKTRRIPHRGVAARHVGVNPVGRLNIGESRDDHPPDALDGVERQKPAMPLDKRPHHRGFARGTERRTPALTRLDLDQRVDDAPSRHEKLVHFRIDSVDLHSEIGEGRLRRLGHG